MRITKEQYDEYEKLKKWAKKEGIFQSAKSIKRLEDDIDFPVKKCVAMFSLLGCEPKYSCCGFDYDGQPLHKSHQYGRPYFVLSANRNTVDLLRVLSGVKTYWYAGRGASREWINIQYMADANPYWRKEECIHFAEECVSGIVWMERFLYTMKDEMMDSIDLIDTNVLAKQDTEYWQYPPKETWEILKKDIFT